MGTKITPRFKVGQKVISIEHRLSRHTYAWMRINKVEVLGVLGKPQPFYYFIGEVRPAVESDVFASEEELTAKTGKKVNELAKQTWL